MKLPNHLWLAAASSLLFSCHLERLTDTSPCANAPKAAFEVSQSACDLPCPITITNITESADSYEWNLGNGVFSTARDPGPIEYTTPGQKFIKLTIQSGECVDSVTKIVTVGSSSRFKGPLNLGLSSVIPYGAVERADGKFQCLYSSSSTIQSAMVDILGQPEGTPLNLGSNLMIIEQVTASNGGFLLSGSNPNSTAAKVAMLDANQQLVPNFVKEFQFGSSTNSLSKGVILNNAGELTTTGYRTQATPRHPGIARVNASGSITTSLINGPASGNVDSFGGVSVAQRSDGDYFITANFLNPVGGDIAILIWSKPDGLYQALVDLPPLNFANKIVRINDNSYVVIGRNNAATPTWYALGLSISGFSISISWIRDLSATAAMTDVRDVTISTDNEVVICGSASSNLIVAKFPPDNGTNYTWQRPFTESGSTLSGRFITKTADGGYLISGQSSAASGTAFYLIKTDSEGRTQ